MSESSVPTGRLQFEQGTSLLPAKPSQPDRSHTRDNTAVTSPITASSAAGPASVIIIDGSTGNTIASTPFPAPGDAAKDLVEPCSHLKRPQYYGRPASQLCPVCRMEKCIRDLRRAETVIRSHGTRSGWIEHAFNDLTGSASKTESNQMKFWTGGWAKKETGRHVHSNGIWLSHPRAKTNLLKLELQCSGKLAWDDNETLLGEAMKRLLDHVAKNALDLLNASKDDRKIGTLEDISATHGRKRGRDMQLAATPDFPDPQDYYSKRRAIQLTQEQKDFIAAAGDDDTEYQPPYKRRKRSEKDFDPVDFDAYVYTREQADVDALFLDPKDKLEKSIRAIYEARPLTPAPGGILRSVENFAPVRGSFSQTLQGRAQPPKRPYTYSSLDTREDKTTQWRRRRLRASPGYEVANTSGYKSGHRRKMTFEEWDAYVEESMAQGLEERREREMYAHAMNARFRPHGGLASVFAFGDWVGSGALGMARRYLW